MDSTINYVVSSSQKPGIVTLVPIDIGSRYKTKQLQVQIVGKSKMIRTVFTNINEVAKCMQIPPSYIVHFMGYETGTQAKFDSKKPEGQQASISGEHSLKDLSGICCQFIEQVLLCPVCGLPELSIYVKGKSAMGNCRACGNQSELPVINDKFMKFIVTHPPEASANKLAGSSKLAAKKTSKKVGSKKDKAKDEDKDDKDEDKEDDAVEENGNGNAEGGDDDVVWFSDTSEEAVKKRREQMLPETLIQQNN